VEARHSLPFIWGQKRNPVKVWEVHLGNGMPYVDLAFTKAEACHIIEVCGAFPHHHLILGRLGVINQHTKEIRS
jgi:hypothetical protein